MLQVAISGMRTDCDEVADGLAKGASIHCTQHCIKALLDFDCPHALLISGPNPLITLSPPLRRTANPSPSPPCCPNPTTEKKGKERKGTERNGTERNGTERRGEERKGKERKKKGKKGRTLRVVDACKNFRARMDPLEKPVFHTPCILAGVKPHQSRRNTQRLVSNHSWLTRPNQWRRPTCKDGAVPS